MRVGDSEHKECTSCMMQIHSRDQFNNYCLNW